MSACPPPVSLARVLGPALCVFGLALPVLAQDDDPVPAKPPSIVFIMSDELGYYELSCMGHPNIQTPNVDRIVAEGLRFTQCLAGSAVCAPTRCCLLTGKHSGHTSVRTNGGATPLRAGEETIGSVLKRSGYATGGFGKWGCGGRGSTGVPEQHGFDTFVGYYDQVHAHTYFPPYIVHNSEEIALAGNKGGRQGTTYSHYVIFDGAKKFIRANKDQPFFCYMPVTPPHGFFNIPDEDPAWQIYKDKEWPEDARRYAAMVTMLDRQVGELLALLRELGVANNTIVMFGGDNGGKDYFKDEDHPRGFHAPNVDPKTKVEFRGQKGHLYEGGLRIPMIAYWPGRIEGGRVSEHLCYFPDFLPTFAEIAGAKVPGDLDGISFVPELFGEAAAGRKQQRHEYLYWELGRQVAVRMGSWKAIQPLRGGPWELYDLSRDVSEQEDVAEAHADILAKMQRFAKAAHEPARVGTFTDRSKQRKDARARGNIRRAGGGR
ncbi:MAG: arylsulfatase [bacterium]|nr:arylsulfatase [bacterium]